MAAKSPVVQGQIGKGVTNLNKGKNFEMAPAAPAEQKNTLPKQWRNPPRKSGGNPY